MASLYYSQPMLGVLGPDMQADSRVVGLVPTLTQLGYALGILLLAPLGDRFDRRRIIVIKSIALMLAQPSMIKRPVLDLGGRTIVGFKPEIYAAALKPAA